MKTKTITKFSLIAAMMLTYMLTGCAPVTVSSVPSNAQVYNKGKDKLLGTTPLKVNLIANEKEVVIRKVGYFSKTVELSPIAPENIEVKLSRRDRVLLVTKPEGAEIFVEGVGRIGRTPFRIDYKKPYRTFELKAPGYTDYTLEITEDPEGDYRIDMNRNNAVIVESKPKKADVYSNGKLLGTTPIAIPAGIKQELKIRKEGYYAKDFSIDETTVSPFVMELERQPIIIVYTEPEGALVVHRGVTLGRTPFRQLAKTDMDLELSFDRHYTEKITIAPDSPREVRISMRKKPYVTIRSKPEGGQLFRSGGVELLGTTPVEVLVEKDMAFEVHKVGYDIKPFMLSPESNREVSVPLRQSAASMQKTVLIDSKPSGAKVYRPGGAEFIGETPLEQFVRGERTFELQLDGFKTKIVTVAPDSADNIVFALAKDESARNVTVSDPLLNTPSSF